MTCLVEDIIIKISINHCESDSKVLGGPVDMRKRATDYVAEHLVHWLEERILDDSLKDRGIEITFQNTGLYEAPEISGSDN